MDRLLPDTLALAVSIAVLELETADFIPRHYKQAFRHSPQLLGVWGDRLQFTSREWKEEIFALMRHDFRDKDWAVWPAYVNGLVAKRGRNTEFHHFENLTKAEAFSEIAKALAIAAFATEEIRVGGVTVRGQNPKIRAQASAIASRERQQFGSDATYANWWRAQQAKLSKMPTT